MKKTYVSLLLGGLFLFATSSTSFAIYKEGEELKEGEVPILRTFSATDEAEPMLINEENVITETGEPAPELYSDENAVTEIDAEATSEEVMPISELKPEPRDSDIMAISEPTEESNTVWYISLASVFVVALGLGILIGKKRA